MDKEKDIQGMANVIYPSNACKEMTCGKCWYKKYCDDYKRAEKLSNAGYGNKKQAIKEFAEKLKQSLSDKYQSLNVLAHNSFLALPAILDVVKEVEQELYGED